MTGVMTSMRLLVIARWVWERGELDSAGIPAVAAVRGHRVEVVGAEDAEGALAMVRDWGPDAVICRFSNDSEAIDASCALQREGVLVIGGGEGVRVGDDQLLTIDALRRAGITVPDCVAIRRPEEAAAAIAAVGSPAVTKDPGTMAGVGVRLAEDAEAICRHLSDLRGGSLIVQRFYSECAGVDHRLFVVGGKVVGAVRRVALPGEFRANLWLGGSAQPHRPTAPERRLAGRAAEAVGLDVAGVDVLHTRDGLVAVEVNPNPGVTGMDEAATAIVEHAEIAFQSRKVT